MRSIPSVNELLDSPPLRKLLGRLSRNVVVSTVRTVLDEMRNELQTAASERSLPSVPDLAERIARRITAGEPPALRPVINATGILLHPGLGGPPLAQEAIDEMSAVAGDYASVEINLATGEPAHQMAAVEDLLKELTGAEAALVVNSDAGATMLTLAALAARREVIVARGQLTDLGGGFRLADAIAASGALLREVGAANTSRPDDYAQAFSEKTAALMLVEPCNYAVMGFSAGVGVGELVPLARRFRLHLIHALGAAGLIDLAPFGLGSVPVAAESLRAGADVVMLGDSLLGGPQCGIILGRRVLLELIERHPLARALKVDKRTPAALAATLRLYRDPERARQAIPLLHLLSTSLENLRNRAERLAPQIAATPAVAEAAAVAGVTHVGEQPIPSQELPTWCIAVKPAATTVDRLATSLRTGSPPVLARMERERLLLDLRSVMPRQDVELVAVFEAIGGPPAAAEPSSGRERDVFEA